MKYVSCMIDNNYDPERIGIDVNIILTRTLYEMRLIIYHYVYDFVVRQKIQCKLVQNQSLFGR